MIEPNSLSVSALSPSLLGLVGHTPLVKTQRLDTGCCELYLKLESHNPGGSIKDRIALAMIEAAERSGALQPGGLLIEATAGNTGLALALVAAQKGYRIKLVIPDKMSQEKIFHLRALGAEVIITRSDVQRGHPDYYQDVARRLAEAAPGAFYVNQFSNPANPLAHETGTGPELWAQTEGKLDVVVVGVGSGGTLTGLGRYFARVNPQLEMVLADPVGSILAPLVKDGAHVTPGSWLVEGIGEDFVPDNCDLALVKQAYSISDAESIQTARLVLRQEGILCGSSSGTLIAAALRYCRAQTTPKRVVTFVCDSGNKYLSKIYNDFWLDDQGLIERTQCGDLRDLIARPFLRGQVICAAPTDTLQQVYASMKLHDLAQLPVLENGAVLGVVEEMDILLAVAENQKAFTHVARDVMRPLLALRMRQPMRDVLDALAHGRYVGIYDGAQFLGLVTPTDVLNYLRHQRLKG